MRELISTYCNQFYNDSSEPILKTSNGIYETKESNWRSLSHEIQYLKSAKSNYQRLDNLILKLKKELSENDIHNHLDSSDSSNGVIGGAWLIDGLISAYEHSNDSVFLEYSESIIRDHKFNKKTNLWSRPNNGRVDQTLNHQIWFACSVFKFSEKITEGEFKTKLILELTNFLDNLLDKLFLHDNGIVHHRSLNKFDYKSYLRNIFIGRKKNISHDVNLVYKSIGYFPFLMLPLIYLENKLESTLFFKSAKWSKMKTAILNENLLPLLCSEMKYGIGYNLSILEMFSIYEHYNLSFPKELVDKQIGVINKLSNKKLNLAVLKCYELNYLRN